MDLKRRFIELRAENKSYDEIAKEINISKATCTAWNKELEEEISTLKKDELNALYNSYHMTREARIRQLGETLNKIDQEIESIDLSDVPPEKLLDYKLKYTEALKKEYIPISKPLDLGGGNLLQNLVMYHSNLLDDFRAGEITGEQVQVQLKALGSVLSLYNSSEIQRQLDLLLAVVGE